MSRPAPSQESIDGWNASPFSITSYAPSHRQFRLSAKLTEEQITAALGIEPTRRENALTDGKVSVEWKFFAEKRYHDGTDIHSVSTCCKIWDYQGSRWSAYGFPEAFEQVGLTPQMVSEHGYEEDGNPTIALLLTVATASDTIARLEDELNEAKNETWPLWASDLLDILRKYTGPCPEDSWEGVDLPEEMRVWFEGYRDEMGRAALGRTPNEIGDPS